MDFLFDKYDYIIACDPGFKGGIAILDINNDKMEVYEMPIQKKEVGTKKKPKQKTELDELKIVEIFEKNKDKKILFVIEKTHSMPGEGSSSSYNFGWGNGFLKGVARGFYFEINMVSPTVWKDFYPELQSSVVSETRILAKSLKLEIKELNKKTQKNIIKEKKKELDKINRSIKSNAKSLARGLAAEKVSYLKDEFKLISSDGKAESVLIALFTLGKLNELVSSKQNNKRSQE